MKIAWVVKGHPIRNDYTRGYPFLRFYSRTVAEICRRLNADVVHVIGTADYDSRYIQTREGGDCEIFRQMLPEKTNVRFINWDSYPGRKYDLVIAGIFSNKGAEFKKEFERLWSIVKPSGEFLYLDSDHEVTDNGDWILSKQLLYFLKRASIDNHPIKKRVSEIWVNEGPPGYDEDLDKHGYRKWVYCPYIADPIDAKIGDNKGDDLTWVFLKNLTNWEGKLDEFLDAMEEQVLWYISPLPAKTVKEKKYLQQFGTQHRRAQVWPQEKMTEIYGEAKMTFFASRPINRLTSKMNEALKAGCVTPMPMLDKHFIGEYFSEIYSNYYKYLQPYIVDCAYTKEMNRTMIRMSNMDYTRRRALYRSLVLFHNDYFNPENLGKIGSKLL